MLAQRPWTTLLVVASLICLATRAPGQLPGDVPDPGIMVALVPAAANAGPPPVIKPGTRIVWFGAAATVPGSRQQLVLDANGNWVNKTTGQRFGEQEVPGGGGAGYNVVQVGYVDKKLVQLSNRLYLLDIATRTSMYTSGGGMVTHAGCAADYWIHPDALKTIQEVNQPGLRILRMPYTVNNRRYNAIRFQTDSDKGYHAGVYDLETGLLIFHCSSVQGAGVFTPSPTGRAELGAGSTQIVTGWLMEVKDIDLPWKNAPAPAWVNTFRELRYQGAQSSIMPDMPPFSRPMTISITPKARGENWLRFASASVIQSLPGIPPEQGASDGSCGAATLGGMWVAPQALANLRQGQLIERNEVTGTTTTVSQAGPGGVTISEVGVRHRIDWSYDPASGILGAMSTAQKVGIATITYQLQLAGRQ